MHFSLENLGRAIASRRHQCGFTQAQLAIKAGLNRTYLSDVEQGHRNVTLDVLTKICSTLGVNMSDLLSHAEQSQRREL